MHWLFLIVLVFCSCNAEDDGIEAFRQLSDINSKWLQATSFPEAATLLNRPPYSYHLKDLSASENGSQDLDPFTDLSLRAGSQRSRVSGAKSCSDDILQILFNLESAWALKMLDSDGKPDSGILRGSLTWPGHFRECTSAYAPKDDEGHGGFNGQYCATAWNLNLGKLYQNLPVTVGLCVPDSCTERELESFGGNLLSALGRNPIFGKLNSFVNLTSVTCKVTEQTPDAPSIVYLVFISFFILLTLIGSVITVIDRRKKFRTDSTRLEQSTLPGSEVNYGTIQAADTSYKQLPRSEAEASNDKSPLALSNDLRLPEKIKDESVVKRILKCFSAIENGERLLNVNSSEGHLPSIHGIRFLSLTWVILGHTYISGVAMIENRLDVLNAMDNLAYQGLLQAPFSVDSFFLLSGFLLTYIFLREADKRNGKINWIQFYVHRIWRLTPAYMVVVFFYIVVFKYISSGPFWEDHHGDAARGDWWKYLLYINNFIPIRHMAVGWSWYLANDMQFYVISPIFLYPLWRWPKAGFSILITLLIGSWTATGIISYQNEITPMFIGMTGGAVSDLTAYSDKMWDSFDLIYDKPYCRIAPYIIGVFLGYALYKCDKKKNFMHWGHQILGWSTAAFCSLSVVYGLYHVEMSRTTALFYNSLSRSAFSVGLAWVIFACETGHGGFITKILSWKFLIPLSRLTYCAYLVHPIIVHAYYLGLQTSLYYTEMVMVTNFLGFLLMAYGLAFVFSLTFESPLMNLEKLLLKGRSI